MNFRNITLWVFIALIVFGLFNLFSNTSGERNIIDLTYSQFLDEVEAGSVKDVVIRGSNINGAFDDGRSFKTYAANDPTLVDLSLIHISEPTRRRGMACGGVGV